MTTTGDKSAYFWCSVGTHIIMWQFSESVLCSHHIICTQIFQIPLQGKMLLAPKEERRGLEVITLLSIQEESFLAFHNACVLKGMTPYPLGTMCFLYPELISRLPGSANLHAQYISSKAIRKAYKGRCVHLKNKTQPVGHYSIQIFIIIPESWPREILWYRYRLFPSKAKDYENNRIIMFKKCALWQITVTPEAGSEHTSDL